jgi:predicted nucleic acid-binding protein
MAVVVDASAVAAIAYGEAEGDELAAYLERETLLAPAILDYELASVALKKVRRHGAVAAEVFMSLHSALRLPISRVNVPMIEAFTIAQHTGLSAYDASYLWLARTRDLELVTLDRVLAKHANQAR